MKVLIGLGNPTKEYERSRHNTGFILLDRLAERQGLGWKLEKRFNAKVAKKENLLLFKPRTFMNASGGSVSKLVNYYNLDLDSLIVVHDDIDMDFGQTRFKKGMGSGGHKGVESIIEKLGSQDFWRFKVGVGRPDDGRIDPEDWVLSSFEDGQVDLLKEQIFEKFVSEVGL